MARILVAAEDAACRLALRELFERSGHSVAEVSESRKVVSEACSRPYDLMILDLHLPKNSRRAIKTILEECPELYIIVMAQPDLLDSAVDAVKLGAADYAILPLNLDDIRIRFDRIANRSRLIEHNRHLMTEISNYHRPDNHIGSCAAVKEALDFGTRTLESGSAVLICGESGVGREHLARTIHQNLRSSAPFVRVNRPVRLQDCLEIQIFGHENNGTGKIGRIELANSGTIFINEITSLSAKAQARLLTALKQKQFCRVDGTASIKSDFRLIATTACDLAEAVEQGTFDSELYAILAKAMISLPPLRDRIEDIPALVDVFIKKYASETGKSVSAISDAAIAQMLDYLWLGNIRELENCVQRCVIVCDGECIQTSHLSMAMGKSLSSRKQQVQMKSLREVERDHIKKVLTQCNWNRSTAASVLDIDRKTLRSKIREFGFIPPEEK